MEGQPPQVGAISIDLAEEDGKMEVEQRPGSEVTFDSLVVQKMLESSFSEEDTLVEDTPMEDIMMELVLRPEERHRYGRRDHVLN